MITPMGAATMYMTMKPARSPTGQSATAIHALRAHDRASPLIWVGMVSVTASASASTHGAARANSPDLDAACSRHICRAVGVKQHEPDQNERHITRSSGSLSTIPDVPRWAPSISPSPPARALFPPCPG